MAKDLEGRIDDLLERASFAKGADHAINEIADGGWKEGAKKLEASGDTAGSIT
jgi:hypothetical protein